MPLCLLVTLGQVHVLRKGNVVNVDVNPFPSPDWVQPGMQTEGYEHEHDAILIPHDHLLLDSAPNIGPLITCWELDKCKNCRNKSFRTSRILILLYQQFLNLLISQRYMSGPRLGALSNNRWSRGTIKFLYEYSAESSRMAVVLQNINRQEHQTINKVFVYGDVWIQYSASYKI